MHQKSADTRDLLVTAALSILMEGKEVLTLDGVARKAGVSRGGLFHHFPTREVLVEAVVDALVKRLDMISGEAPRHEEIGSPREARAYIEECLDPVMREAAADVARGVIRLCGSEIRQDAPFLNPWRRQFSSRLDRFREAGDLEGFAWAAVMVLAVESFTLVDVFNLYAFSDQEIEAIKGELLARMKA